ncbi:hypothetical protein [Microscilla marina]|uniref:Lipocalin-like domain-containing protein n=1 Tax=Microscilla marina ATCC 23134 TaxID=313606 RepID=A1ZW44_MICM2|nr:hypothetical protein [Microscilla marina]EAY25407.1 hypothetical protein M23134_06666 [Microscilla marina ATCC 23134]
MKILILSVCMLLLLPKSATQEVNLTHKWQITWCGFASFFQEYEKFSPVERATYQKKLKKAFIRFKSNQTYSMQVFDTKDRGTWATQNNLLVLKSNEGVKVKFMIEKTSAKELTLLNVQKKDTLLIKIRR